MSVLFLPPSAGAASIPDASETVAGKIRIATSAEATAGTDDLTSMTPAKTKSVIDAAVVGGVTYQGTFDTSAPVDLSNASQGDLYIISVAGSYQGQTWAVGDHLLINADMGGTIDPAKIDKVDNTDAVTSVAGRTGAVVLSSADISGLATVATSGAYSDLSGTPTLATVATSGAYSDLSGTPEVPDFQTITVSANTTLSSSLEDGCYLIVFTSNATVTIPAYTAGKNLVFRFANFGVGACTIQQASGVQRLYEFGDYGVTGVNSVTLNSGVTRTFHLWAAGSSLGLNYWSEANPFSTSATIAALDDVGDVAITGASNTQVIKYNSTSGDWENGAVAYSEVTGTPTLGTAAAEDVGTSAGNVVQLDGSARLPAVDGSQLTNLPSGASTLGALTDVDVTGAVNTNVLKYNSTSGDWEDGAVAYSEVTGTPSLATVATTGAYSDLSGTPTLAAIATTGDYSDLNDSVVWQQFNTTTTAAAINSNALHVFRLYAGGITLTLAPATVANGFALFHNISGSDVTISGSGAVFRANGEGASGGSSSITVKAGERRLYYLESVNIYMEANSTRLERSGNVNITSVANNEVIKYNSTSGDWENGAVTYSEVTGTPTLGTAAAEDVGTSANNVVQLDGTAKLPAVDGSQLTNLPTAGYPSLTSASPSSTYTISSSAGFMEIYLLNPSVAITANIPAPSAVAAGYRYNIKNLSTNNITITPASGNIDGASTVVLNVQYSAVTLVSDQANWFII